MSNDRSCFVFLADLPEKREVLNLYCKVDSYTSETAKAHVAHVLQARGVEAGCKVLYVGVIDFHDCEEEVIERQNTFFDKQDAVGILSCSYK